MAGIFKAYDIRGIYGEALNDEIAYMIGLGLANEVYDNQGPIVVTRDVRAHSDPVTESLVNGLLDGGCDVIDLGLAATPMNYWANKQYNAHGSVQVTASHNPAEYNGFKMSKANAVPIAYADGIDKVEAFVERGEQLKAETRGQLTVEDSALVLETYLKWQNEFVNVDNPRPVKIGIDCANGMAGYFIKEFLSAHDWIEAVPLYWELDGTFPNHEADPQKVENLVDLQALIRENNCDFGVAFDGDADRAVFVDDKGEPISSDLMTALIAVNYLKENPGASIGYDLRSSSIVPEMIEQAGGKAIRTKVGHSNIKKLMREKDIAFAGELSGHFYFKECYYTDSALMTMIQAVNLWQASNAPMSEMIENYRKYFATGEINYRVASVAEVLSKVESQYKDFSLDHLDGLTVEGENWWFNLRASNTEPLLRLNLEAKDQSLRDEKLNEVKAIIE